MTHDSLPGGNVVVLGARSAVGSELVRRLAGSVQGRLVACGRSPVAGLPCDEWRHLDLAHAGAADELASMRPAVILCAAPIFLAAPHLASASTRCDPLVVACSSMSAVAKASSALPRERQLSESLLAAERTLRDPGASRRVTILRPTMIWGSGSDANVGTLVRFARRFRFLVAPGPPTGLRQPVHFADVASAMLAAARTGAAAGRILELGGGERLPATELVRRVARAARVPCLTVPHAAWHGAGAGIVRMARPSLAGALHRLTQDQLADNEHAARLLGVRPRGFILPADLS